MKPTELAALLQECYRDRLALTERHRAVAVHLPAYDVNNTYQYIINREETHLEWIASALSDLGVPLPALDACDLDLDGDALYGVLYVLEGSALGSRVLFERAQALGLSATHGARHLAQASAIDSWRNFLTHLETGADLETAYRVMRTFMMLKEKPARVEALRTYIAKCRNEDGGYAIAPGEMSTVSGTYFATIVRKWLD